MHKNIFSLVFLLACSSKSSTDSASSEETDDTSDTEDTTDTSDTNTEPTASFSGSLEFADGTEVSTSAVRVQMCLGSCYIGMLDGNTFTFPALVAGTYAFDLVPLAGEGERSYATPIDFIEITTDVESHSLAQAVIINTFETTLDPIASGSVAAAGDLTIEVDENAFTPREGFEDYTFLASVRVDPAESGLPLNSLPEDIVGMWQLGAFEAHVSPGWSFSVANTELAPGTQLRVFNASYDEVMWKEVGTATVDDNGVVQSDDGTGIEILSALVITL